jgi:hypothetical protein
MRISTGYLPGACKLCYGCKETGNGLLRQEVTKAALEFGNTGSQRGMQELEALQKAIALEIHDPDSGTDDGYVWGGRG